MRPWCACSRAKLHVKFSLHLRSRKKRAPMTKQNESLEPLIPFAQAAKILNMSERTLKRRVHDGEIAVIRDGAIVSFAPEDLRFYIATRRIDGK